MFSGKTGGMDALIMASWTIFVALGHVRVATSKEYAKCTVKLDLKDCDSPPISEDLCNKVPPCSKDFNIVYMDHKPYSAEILSDTMRMCCGSCVTSSVVQNISKVADISHSLMNTSHFVFPLLGRTDAKRLYGYWYLPIFETPSVYYITHKENNIVYILIMSCLNMWPLFLVCSLMVIISGFLCWLAEMRRNKDEFPKSFASGWFEGIWWSFISMTTVGYGDKTPKSVSGRLLSIIWIVVGITSFSLITATLTSEIVAANNVPPPKIGQAKVGLINHHKYEGMLVAKEGGLIVGIDPPNLTEGIHQLIEMMDNKMINGFILDRYELMLFYNYFKNDTKYQHDVQYMQANTVLTEVAKDGDYAYGVLVKLDEDYRFLVDFLSSNSDVLNTCNSLFLSKYSQDTIAGLDKEKAPLFSTKGMMFWPSFVACAVLIVICVAFGGVYELHRKDQFILSKLICLKKGIRESRI